MKLTTAALALFVSTYGTAFVPRSFVARNILSSKAPALFMSSEAPPTAAEEAQVTGETYEYVSLSKCDAMYVHSSQFYRKLTLLSFILIYCIDSKRKWVVSWISLSIRCIPIATCFSEN